MTTTDDFIDSERSDFTSVKATEGDLPRNLIARLATVIAATLNKAGVSNSEVSHNGIDCIIIGDNEYQAKIVKIITITPEYEYEFVGGAPLSGVVYRTQIGNAEGIAQSITEDLVSNRIDTPNAKMRTVFETE